MNKHVIVGSYAWHLVSPNIKFSDIDVWYCGEKPDITIPDRRIDYKKIPDVILNQFTSRIPNLNELYTIKCSHLGWTINAVSRSPHHP